MSEAPPAAAAETGPPPARASGWLGAVTARLEGARTELTQCFDASEVADGMGVELRLDFDAQRRVTSRVVAGDNATCPAKDCIQTQIRKALSTPIPAPSPPHSVPLVLRHHPKLARRLELRTDGATLNLRGIDCDRWAMRAATREAREEIRRQALLKPLGDDLERYRSGLENCAYVKRSQQRSLRTSRPVFATYLNAVHNAVHPVFSDQYLAGLERLPRTDPLNDMTLEVTIELVIDAQGNIARMGVVQSSGIVQFDASALHSFATAAPFLPPPAAILSADGNAYLRWSLFRDPRYACSTYFARPFLLKS